MAASEASEVPAQGAAALAARAPAEQPPVGTVAPTGQAAGSCAADIFELGVELDMALDKHDLEPPKNAFRTRAGSSPWTVQDVASRTHPNRP